MDRAIRFVKGADIYNSGEIAVFPEAVAARFILAGDAVAMTPEAAPAPGPGPEPAPEPVAAPEQVVE